jgi:hypothetical protein
MTNTFEINGKTYKTDEQTIKVLRSIMESAKQSNDYSAVIAVMEIGQLTHSIEEVK